MHIVNKQEENKALIDRKCYQKIEKKKNAEPHFFWGKLQVN